MGIQILGRIVLIIKHPVKVLVKLIVEGVLVKLIVHPPMVVGLQYLPFDNGKIKSKYLNKKIILVRRETNQMSFILFKVTKEKYRYKLLVKSARMNGEGAQTKTKPYVAWWKPSRGIADQKSPSTFLQNMLEDGYKIDRVR
jgi:hypothetical protein